MTPAEKLEVAIAEYIVATGETLEDVATEVICRIPLERKATYLGAYMDAVAAELDAKFLTTESGIMLEKP